MKNLIALLFSGLIALQLINAQATVQESFKVSEKNEVNFNLTFAKDIQIQTWDKNEVQITAKVILNGESTRKGYSIDIKKGQSEITVQSKLDYNKIPTSVIEPDENGEIDYDGEVAILGFNNGEWTAVRHNLVYEVNVPNYLAINVCTNRGNVEVKGVNASMDIKTNNGFIDVDRNPSNRADVKLVTNSGEIFTDFEVNEDSRNKERKRNQCEAVKISAAINGGGGDDITLNSSCGNIYLRKMK